MKISGLPIALILGVSFGAWTLAEQSAAPENADVSGIVERMKSGDLHTQTLAFDNLMTLVQSEAADGMTGKETRPPIGALRTYLTLHPGQADSIKVQLIELLKEENSYFVEDKNTPPDPHQEDDISEHYAELIETVASLDDPRAASALVGAMTTGGIAQRGLLKYGDATLAPVTAQLNSPNALVRASALGTAITLLKKHKDEQSDARIHELIHMALTDPKPVVRSHAVKEIDCLDDRKDFIPLLQEIAKSDPFKLPGKADDGGDGDDFFPVRFAARSVLRDINNKQTCN